MATYSWQVLPAKLVDQVFGFADFNKLRNNALALHEAFTAEHDITGKHGPGYPFDACGLLLGNDTGKPTLVENGCVHVVNVERVGTGAYRFYFDIPMVGRYETQATVGTTASRLASVNSVAPGYVGVKVIRTSDAALQDLDATEYLSVIVRSV